MVSNEDDRTQAPIRKFRLQPKTACEMIARSLALKLGRISITDLISPEDPKTRKIISARSLTRRFEAGARVYPLPELESSLMLLDEGSLEIFFDCDGSHMFVRKLEAGAILGELPRIGLQMFGTVATAATASQLSLLDLEAVKAVASKLPPLAWEWVHQIGASYASSEVDNELLKHATLPSKISSLLLSVVGETGAVLGLSEQAIADRTGARRESVVAAIARMKQAGLLEVGGREKILLTNIPALHKLKIL